MTVSRQWRRPPPPPNRTRQVADRSRSVVTAARRSTDYPGNWRKTCLFIPSHPRDCWTTPSDNGRWLIEARWPARHSVIIHRQGRRFQRLGVVRRRLREIRYRFDGLRADEWWWGCGDGVDGYVTGADMRLVVERCFRLFGPSRIRRRLTRITGALPWPLSQNVSGCFQFMPLQLMKAIRLEA